MPLDNYLEIVSLSIATKDILGDDFSKAFFNKNDSFINNFSNTFGTSQSNRLIDFCSSYSTFADISFLRPDKYDKMEHVFCDMIYSHCRKNNLDIDDFRDKLFKNPVYREEDGVKINLNEKIYTKIKTNLEHIRNIQSEMKENNKLKQINLEETKIMEKTHKKVKSIDDLEF